MCMVCYCCQVAHERNRTVTNQVDSCASLVHIYEIYCCMWQPYCCCLLLLAPQSLNSTPANKAGDQPDYTVNKLFQADIVDRVHFTIHLAVLASSLVMHKPPSLLRQTPPLCAVCLLSAHLCQSLCCLSPVCDGACLQKPARLAPFSDQNFTRGLC